MQELFVFLLFFSALFYLGRQWFGSSQEPKGCASGCSACSSIDFRKIEKAVRQNQDSHQQRTPVLK